MSLKLISEYLEKAYSSVDDLLDIARESLPATGFDTFIGTGLSGALVVPLLGRTFDINWAIVRKPEESSHAMYTVEGRIGQQWVFVDDLISRGTTLTRVQNAVSETSKRYSH